jgi:hypothetical protein
MNLKKKNKKKTMGRGTFRGAGGDENLKINFMWPNIIYSNNILVYRNDNHSFN